MGTMIKRMAAVLLMALVGLGLAVSPSFATEEPSTCDTLALDPDATFAYIALVTIPDGGHAPEFCELYQQNVPAGKFVFHYEPPAGGFHMS